MPRSRSARLRVNVRELGVDLLSVAGHKLYAPKGVGALYVRRGTPLVPFVLGAGHERGLRPGTENVAAIVGLGMACEIAGRDMESRRSAHRRPAGRAVGSGSKPAVPGHPAQRPSHAAAAEHAQRPVPRASGNAILAGAPEIAASTGSACHAADESASAVILAMGVAADEAIGSVRLTLGRGTTSSDIVAAADALVRSWQSVAPVPPRNVAP